MHVAIGTGGLRSDERCKRGMQLSQPKHGVLLGLPGSGKRKDDTSLVRGVVAPRIELYIKEVRAISGRFKGCDSVQQLFDSSNNGSSPNALLLTPMSSRFS